MTSPEEAALAASLQTEWAAETAAVYADLLIARGDPRGELIAVELALANDPRAELAVRKRELIQLWIGGAIAGWTWHPHNVEHGLLRGFMATNSATYALVEIVEHLLDAVGNHLRDLGLYASNVDLTKALTVLARTEGGLPWLRTLTIKRTDGARPIDRATWQAVVDATPHLTELILEGTGVIASPLHPAVRTLRIQGFAIAVGGQPFDAVTHLDFRFADPLAYGAELPPVDKLAGVVNPRAFPALRTLDVSRNAFQPIALAVLAAVEDLARFDTIRFPAITNDGAATLIDLLERYPRLVIEIARSYAPLDVSHPRLLVPTPRAWPAQPHGRDALRVAIPGGTSDGDLALSSLVGDLEDQFDAMHDEARTAWIVFWTFLDTLPWEDDNGNAVSKPMSVAVLSTALEALVSNGRADNVAKDLREARFPPDATVNVSRYWGW